MASPPAQQVGQPGACFLSHSSACRCLAAYRTFIAFPEELRGDEAAGGSLALLAREAPRLCPARAAPRFFGCKLEPKRTSGLQCFVGKALAQHAGLILEPTRQQLLGAGAAAGGMLRA